MNPPVAPSRASSARLPDLDQALTLRARRRVRNDGTLSVGGVEWELEQGFLAGKLVTVGRSLLDAERAPWVEHEGRALALRKVNAKRNAKRRRQPVDAAPRGIDVPFSPADALLARRGHRAWPAPRGYPLHGAVGRG